LLRTFQAQIAKKIRTFASGSASAKKKNDVLTKKKECIQQQSHSKIMLETAVQKSTLSFAWRNVARHVC